MLAALQDLLLLVNDLTAYYPGDVANDPSSDAYTTRQRARAAIARATLPAQ